MIIATKWITHYIRTLIPDMLTLQTSYTEAFDANQVTLAHPRVSHVSSVSIDVGGAIAGWNWYPTTWGTTTQATVLKARSSGSKITSVTYSTGPAYVYPGFPHADAKFPRVGIDYGAGLSPFGIGQNASTSEHTDDVVYSFDVSIYSGAGRGKTSLTIGSETYNEHSLLDKLVEVVVEGIQKKGTSDAIPYPFYDLQCTNVSKIIFEDLYGIMHKDISITGKVALDVANNVW